jgi:hypothetical protein
VQYSATNMPDASHYYLRVSLADGDFSMHHTFQGMDGAGRVAFRMDVMDALEPYARFCLSSALLREVP